MATLPKKTKTTLLDSSFPVFIPANPILKAPSDKFDKYINDILGVPHESPSSTQTPLQEQSRKRHPESAADQKKKQKTEHQTGPDGKREVSPSNTETLAELKLESEKDEDDFTIISGATSSYVDVDNDISVGHESELIDGSSVKDHTEDSENFKGPSESGHPLIDALHGVATQDESTMEYPDNKMLTENRGIAYRSTNSALLDLFTELERSISGARLRELLDHSWRESPMDMMKIILNTRSIHLGKGERESFYRCIGWLRLHHPKTLLANLDLLVKPLIDKKPAVDKADNKNTEDLQTQEDGDEVQFGLAHGYWKDLLAILVLNVNDALTFDADPRSILNVKNDQSSDQAMTPPKEGSEWNHQLEAKKRKHVQEKLRHDRFMKKFEDQFHQLLHLTVARLFAMQLRKDLLLLKSGSKKDINSISMAAKWAPSPEGFHDKHTFISSTIAEILYKPKANTTDDRVEYLKQARENYRRVYLSPLRAALDIVERKISKEDFEKIDYQKVPSTAMNNYKKMFIKKDLPHFELYIEDVVSGKSRISGATLNPGQLVMQVLPKGSRSRASKIKARDLVATKTMELTRKTIDAQWQTLVQRIKDSGRLENSIAVCDVSGSMNSPEFPDQTSPMHSSIALSILLSDITAPPFGGTMISFSKFPKVHKIPAQLPFSEKVKMVGGIDFGLNTDFVAVFLQCILPLALENEVKKEDMVKQVFVFSDMQFDQAEDDYYYPGSRSKKKLWATNYDVIKQKFEEHGYDIPRLIFWNLNGTRSTSINEDADPTVPKPVLSDTPNAAIISGYSQGMIKAFLEGGDFDNVDLEEEKSISRRQDEDEFETEAVENALDTMMKALSHKSYNGLVIVD